MPKSRSSSWVNAITFGKAYGRVSVAETQQAFETGSSPQTKGMPTALETALREQS